MDRGLKAQMKYADKIGARFSMVLGDNELAENKARLKNMETGEIKEVAPVSYTHLVSSSGRLLLIREVFTASSQTMRSSPPRGWWGAFMRWEHSAPKS